ncbi:hypothetical protein IF1G_01549 [Cordyceps javanica]|uniref:Uncharacterized protein n=1 Tax=Cordyceps javanica TaxID=43265 RepID=A0A545VC93_9HYPO|nr:hypothetical protein IF1G_01549 [Cordyceps javanica]
MLMRVPEVSKYTSHRSGLSPAGPQLLQNSIASGCHVSVGRDAHMLNGATVNHTLHSKPIPQVGSVLPFGLTSTWKREKFPVALVCSILLLNGLVQTQAVGARRSCTASCFSTWTTVRCADPDR